jgi:hypothetical protein
MTLQGVDYCRIIEVTLVLYEPFCKESFSCGVHLRGPFSPFASFVVFLHLGGVDLAVIDATRTYSGPAARKSKKTDVIIAGKDAVAVETVGATLICSNPKKMPIIQEAAKRGLGEGNIDNIEILGHQ